ncbi:Pectinesterase [Tripterygium wilfordii]|uniref:Pectinesterase n=1 Tax=Tripterygium wilfordii TaxID=458696 RepID=A0A7J7CC05_TRIWF|nr:Pectinesterase [Tripterygium wilfordii]
MYSFLKWYLSLSIVLLMGFQSGLVLANGEEWNRNIKCPRKGGRRRTVDCKSILVDQSGHGNFSSIQSAIDSVQPYNKYWTCIYIKAGTYREKVQIPFDKPYISLKGEGKKLTKIVWDGHESLGQSATFASFADNIVVRRISMVNSYNSPGSNNPRAPAVAALIAGDKSSFYGCGFSGLQDTLWDVQGRHYFKKCSIHGAVDFIFGNGQSIYERCRIQVLGNELQMGLPGYITAQGRTDPNDADGFVFKECEIIGSGSAYLGRAWREYARVLFYNSNFTNVIQPQGWDAWNFAGHEDQLTFVEYGNFGPGSASFDRVKWLKRLDWNAMIQLISITFIDNENWVVNQPS